MGDDPYDFEIAIPHGQNKSAYEGQSDDDDDESNRSDESDSDFSLSDSESRDASPTIISISSL